MMKKCYLLTLGLLASCSVWADVSLEPLLNKVSLQLSAEQWVTTKTALTNVVVNAAVSGQGIEKIQNDVVQKLNQIAKADWHLVSFDRQLDRSGLESIQITAQARLAQSELAGLRDKAKSISKPGETFTLDSVQFTPSEEEIRQANTSLRNNIYAQAKTEIDALNKVYPDQKYYLHQIDLLVPPPVMPMARNMMVKMSSQAVAADASMPTPNLSVGNKVEMQATVVLAAMPDVVTQKLAHN